MTTTLVRVQALRRYSLRSYVTADTICTEIDQQIPVQPATATPSPQWPPRSSEQHWCQTLKCKSIIVYTYLIEIYHISAVYGGYNEVNMLSTDCQPDKKNGEHTAGDIAKFIFVIVAMKLWFKFQGVLPVLTMVQMLMGQHWFRQQPGTG